MQVSVGKKKIRLQEGATVRELLKSLGKSSQVSIVKVNGKVRPESCKLAEGDKVDIIQVVFGG